jgi:hypothetical protein
MSRRLAGLRNGECGKKEEEDEWTDILGNGDLMKKTTRKGDGRRPEHGEFVKISFKNLTDATSDEPTTAQFILGYGFNIDGTHISFVRSILSLERNFLHSLVEHFR